MHRSLSIGFLPLLSLAEYSFAQTFADNPISWAAFNGGASICNNSFSQSNGSGVFHYDPNIPQGSGGGMRNETTGKALPIGAGVTLTTFPNSKPMELSLWLNTNGANYSDDLALGYDVCAMGIGPVPGWVNARGQTDNGSCYDFLDQTCVQAMENIVQTAALSLTLVPTPEPNSNLTAGSLPGVCQSIRNALNSNLPKECSSYFTNQTGVVLEYPLTRYNTSYPTILNSSCILADGYDPYTLIGTAYGVDNTNATYDTLMRLTLPVMLVWMPVANGERTGYLTNAKAGMICPHINKYSDGSRVPSRLSTTPPATSSAAAGNSTMTGASQESGLSGGAIGGIVTAIVLILAAIAALVWFMMRRRKAGTRQVHEIGGGGHSPSDSGNQAFLKETSVVSELDVLHSGRNELPHGQRNSRFAEVAGDDRQFAEMHGTEVNRQELAGSKRQSDIWTWRRQNGTAYELPG